MSAFKENKTAGIFVTILIGLIIISFMFTGYESFQAGMGGGANSVGRVGDMPIKVEEFQMEYNRQLEFYKQITGGQDLTSQQIEAFKVKDNALKNIIQRKLMVKFSTLMGSHPSEEEIKAEIKKLPYFQSNGQFDLERYKGLLAANSLSPQDFEKDMINDLKMRQTQSLMQNFPISNGYLEDLQKFRKNAYNVKMLSISKNALKNQIPVTSEEVQKFLADKTNMTRVESQFNERKESLSTQEEVKARHILIGDKGSEAATLKAVEEVKKTLTVQNFQKVANEKTDDPSGKTNGGDLGFFARGRMVPEFDQVAFTQKPGVISEPVKTQFGYHFILVESKKPAVVATLDAHKSSIATEMIRKDKVEELKKLTVDISNQAKALFDAGKDAELKALADKYKLKFETNVTLNVIDGFSNGTYLTQEQMKQVYASDAVHLFDDASNITMLKALKSTAEVATDAIKAEQEKSGLKMALSRKMMDNVLKKLEADTTVKINNNVLNF